MNPEAPPPSYNEIYKNAPSAPPIEGDFTPAIVNQQFQQQPMPTPIQSAQQTIVIINQNVNLGPFSTNLNCPHCKQNTMTKLNRKAGFLTHMIALLFCCCGWCPCAVMTYCFDCSKDIEHTCSNCKKYLGTYKKSL